MLYYTDVFEMIYLFKKCFHKLTAFLYIYAPVICTAVQIGLSIFQMSFTLPLKCFPFSKVCPQKKTHISEILPLRRCIYPDKLNVSLNTIM